MRLGAQNQLEVLDQHFDFDVVVLDSGDCYCSRLRRMFIVLNVTSSLTRVCEFVTMSAMTVSAKTFFLTSGNWLKLKMKNSMALSLTRTLLS